MRKQTTKTTAKTATTAKKSTTPTVKVSKQPVTYEEIQRSLMDKDTVVEKQLQSRVKSNLRSLKASIEKTRDTIEEQQEKLNALVSSSNVDWAEVVKQESYVESLELGLAKLRVKRDTMFPNWQSILIKD